MRNAEFGVRNEKVRPTLIRSFSLEGEELMDKDKSIGKGQARYKIHSPRLCASIDLLGVSASLR